MAPLAHGMQSKAKAPVDYLQLAESLAVLAYPTRLALLDELRFPLPLGEIRVSPHRNEAAVSPLRPVARQTVQGHLERLVEIGLVTVEEAGHRDRPNQRYVVNPQRLYGIVEELRQLATLYAGFGGPGDETGTLRADAPFPIVEGPRLVLVHGVYEGKAFALSTATARDGRWVVGRSRTCQVPLDYDPFVSVENAFISCEGGVYAITDWLPNKNGTVVNWRRLPAGGTRVLRAGDVIGVGRSSLVFVPD